MRGARAGQPRGVFARGIQNALTYPRVLYRLLFYVVVVGIVVPFLFPLYWLLLLSITPMNVGASPGLLPPADATPVAFFAALEPMGMAPLWRYVLNSLLMAGATTAIVLVVASLAGYVFGRLDFPGRTLLLLATLAIAYFPPASFLLPLYRLFTGNVAVLGVTIPDVYNTPAPVVLPLSALFLPLSIFILTTFYGQIPDNLEDAARVEGATRIGALWRVIVPLSTPGVVIAGVMTFIQVYNEFFFSFLMNDSQVGHWANITFALRNLRAYPDFPIPAAASLIALLPVVVIVLLANEKVVTGLSAGTAHRGLK